MVRYERIGALLSAGVLLIAGCAPQAAPAPATVVAPAATASTGVTAGAPVGAPQTVLTGWTPPRQITPVNPLPGTFQSVGESPAQPEQKVRVFFLGMQW